MSGRDAFEIFLKSILGPAQFVTYSYTHVRVACMHRLRVLLRPSTRPPCRLRGAFRDRPELRRWLAGPARKPRPDCSARTAMPPASLPRSLGSLPLSLTLLSLPSRSHSQPC